MPTYDYRCDACRHEFDAFQSITDAALRKCPKCGKSKLRRLIGAGAGIIFKGSGFYETDYKRSRTPEKGGEAAEKPAEKGPEKKAPKKAKD
jgi:putative FmdB family regulatory protein